MNRKDLIEKIMKVAEHYKNDELYATGAMTDIGILVDEYTGTVVKNCSIPVVVGRSEQLPCGHKQVELVRHAAKCKDCGTVFETKW